MTWVREHVRPITLGDWAFELRDDDIARIRFQGRDVLRSISVVVRDCDWATAVWSLASIEVSHGATEQTAPLDERGDAVAESADDDGRSGDDEIADEAAAARDRGSAESPDHGEGDERGARPGRAGDVGDRDDVGEQT